MMPTDFPNTVSEIIVGLEEKRFSSVEITQALLDKINEQDTTLNSFISVCDDVALFTKSSLHTDRTICS